MRSCGQKPSFPAAFSTAVKQRLPFVATLEQQNKKDKCVLEHTALGAEGKARLGPPSPPHSHVWHPGKSELSRASVSPHMPTRDRAAQHCTDNPHLTLGNQRHTILHKFITDISTAELISVVLVLRAQEPLRASAAPPLLLRKDPNK